MGSPQGPGTEFGIVSLVDKVLGHKERWPGFIGRCPDNGDGLPGIDCQIDLFKHRFAGVVGQGHGRQTDLFQRSGDLLVARIKHGVGPGIHQQKNSFGGSHGVLQDVVLFSQVSDGTKEHSHIGDKGRQNADAD